MAIHSKQIQLKSRPVGMPTQDNFEIIDVTLQDPGAGEMLIKNIYMSVDPYMRGRMRTDWVAGQQLDGGALGKVVASNNPDFKEGDTVLHGQGWREYLISDGKGVERIDASLAPLSTYLGVMGMPGLTAYGGLLTTGEYQPGETLFVSAASGAVGSVVGQIARIKGGTVVGSAGSDEKVDYLVKELGFSHAFNYKTQDALEELKKGAPAGIDVYFENVGGMQLEAALTHMRANGRVAVCGMIAHYNDDNESRTPGPRNLTELIYKRIMLRGFVSYEFMGVRDQFLKDMSSWIKSGEVKYQETVFEGIDNAPNAFMGLFQGANEGKMLVKLAEA